MATTTQPVTQCRPSSENQVRNRHPQLESCPSARSTLIGRRCILRLRRLLQWPSHSFGSSRQRAATGPGCACHWPTAAVPVPQPAFVDAVEPQELEGSDSEEEGFGAFYDAIEVSDSSEMPNELVDRQDDDTDDTDAARNDTAIAATANPLLQQYGDN